MPVRTRAKEGPLVRVIKPKPPDCFIALDFETANHARDSACSVSLVRVEGKKIVERAYHLIRPPSRQFVFSYIHGLTWQDVADASPWGKLWPKLARLLEGTAFIAAHNASFDASVMRACCQTARIAAPVHPFVCTVKLARQTWDLFPTKLPDVCRHLRLKLDHHNALSDAEACAQIVVRAMKDGAEVN